MGGGRWARRRVLVATVAGPAVVAAGWLVPSAAGAGPGPTNTFTTSTTHHDTHTRVDLPPMHDWSTRVTAVFGGVVIFDQIAGDAPGSPAVDALVAQARAALVAAGADSVSGPSTVSSTTTQDEVLVSSTVNHVETSVTTTTTFGPATIFIGPDQSQPFFVAAGSVNVNTNTHTETFYEDTYQVTVHHQDHLELIGSAVAVAPAVTVPAATGPVAATPTTTG